jgi:hypothetical protein
MLYAKYLWCDITLHCMSYIITHYVVLRVHIANTQNPEAQDFSYFETRERKPLQTSPHFFLFFMITTTTMVESPDSVRDNRDEKLIDKGIDVGGKDDNDDDDCSCRTDLTTLRASNTRRSSRIGVRVNPNVWSFVPSFPAPRPGQHNNNTKKGSCCIPTPSCFHILLRSTAC